MIRVAVDDNSHVIPTAMLNILGLFFRSSDVHDPTIPRDREAYHVRQVSMGVGLDLGLVCILSAWTTTSNLQGSTVVQQNDHFDTAMALHPSSAASFHLLPHLLPVRSPVDIEIISYND